MDSTNPQRQKRTRIKKEFSTGQLMANSARKVVDIVTIIYNPKNYNILKRITRTQEPKEEIIPSKLNQMQLA